MSTMRDTEEASAAMMRRYKQKLQEMISTTESNIEHWEKYDKDYVKLVDFMQDAVTTTQKDVKVPFGPFAFIPGQLFHTNEVTVLLGDNWFAERSVAEAIEIVGRRREYTSEQLESLKGTLKDLNARAKVAGMGVKGALGDHQLENSRIDDDGDEVNEEGLKFVEIREGYEEVGPEDKGRGKSRIEASVEAKAESLEPPTKLGEFEQRLFERIAELERKETLGYDEDSDDEEGEDEDEYGDEDIAADSDEERRFEIMDDDDDDYNDGVSSGISRPGGLRPKSSKGPTTAKHVRFSNDTIAESQQQPQPAIRSPADIYKQMAVHATAAAAVNPPPLAAPHRPTHNPSLNDLVIEHDGVDSIDESDTDDFLFGRELLSEYHRKRNLMLQADTVNPLTPEDEYMAQEETNQNRDANISRFRAARMAIRQAVENAIEIEPPVQSKIQRETQEVEQPSTPESKIEDLSKKTMKTVLTPNTTPRVSRFKAARMAATESPATSSSAPTVQNPQPNEIDDEQEQQPRKVTRATAVPVVGRGKPIPEISKPDFESRAISAAPSSTEGKPDEPGPRKMSRFKAQRMGLE
ncbi:hypothetical protein PhCBS80983_g04544 [Powellomyces hirtus]|uniref:DUF3835 domain-containing protein n=1 Tax=Powellomyces hirtus TaxID=109895 RepID=A0A507DXD9_9FUNG|nr:hypothetical protein PhCBS80983_g04544 [Powellomyces hirtus]